MNIKSTKHNFTRPVVGGLVVFWTLEDEPVKVVLIGGGTTVRKKQHLTKKNLSYMENIQHSKQDNSKGTDSRPVI